MGYEWAIRSQWKTPSPTIFVFRLAASAFFVSFFVSLFLFLLFFLFLFLCLREEAKFNQTDLLTADEGLHGHHTTETLAASTRTWTETTSRRSGRSTTPAEGR